jgi:Tfp pilus assembly protein PilW
VSSSSSPTRQQQPQRYGGAIRQLDAARSADLRSTSAYRTTHRTSPAEYRLARHIGTSGVADLRVTDAGEAMTARLVSVVRVQDLGRFDLAAEFSAEPRGWAAVDDVVVDADREVENAPDVDAALDDAGSLGDPTDDDLK